MYTIQPSASLDCHFMQSHIRSVHVCLAVICRLHFSRNDRYLLRATVMLRGCNWYRNKSQHRKLPHGEENSPAAQPIAFRSWSKPSLFHWAIPASFTHLCLNLLRAHYMLAVSQSISWCTLCKFCYVCIVQWFGPQDRSFRNFEYHYYPQNMRERERGGGVEYRRDMKRVVAADLVKEHSNCRD